MTKGRWIFKDGKAIPADQFHREKQQNRQRSGLPRPFIISDTMEHTWNPADGNQYDSKSEYYRAVKESGCEITGNEKIPDQVRGKADKKEIAQDVKTAMDMVDAGYTPEPVPDDVLDFVDG